MPSAEQIDLLLEISGIDRGEAILFAAALNAPDHLMIATGDKRSLTALAAASGCLHIVEGIQGKVFCVEQLVKCVIALRGFDSVKERILPNRDCDTAMKAIFGSGMLTQESNAIRALDSYIADLRQKTTNILGYEEELYS